MNRLHSLLVIGGAIFFAACSSNGESDAHEHEHEEAAHNESKSDEIVLEPEQAERFGVVVDTIEPRQFHEVIKLSGQVISSTSNTGTVSAPTAGILNISSAITPGAKVSKGATIAGISSKGMTGGDQNQAAKANLNAAKRELDRLTPLHKDGIVSTKDYNAALQAYELAKASYSSSAASGVASAPISGTIVELLVKQGDYVEAGQPIATISDNVSLNLKVDLPEKYATLQSQITDANVKLPYSDEYITLSSINGHRVSGTAAAVSSQPGYIPVYFSFNNDGSFIAGSFVDVYLIGALKDNAIVVPVTALSEQQGNFFVYSKIDAEGYKKIHVTIGNSDGNNVEITSGLKGGETIVVKGAPIIKLAESSGAVPEGHNHNH